jgi:acyl carrier protein
MKTIGNQVAINAMIEYLRAKVVRDPSVEILEDTPLVSSGLVDSFALIEVLLQLEKVTNRKISPSDVSPNDLDSVGQMLLTAEKVGKPR